MKTISQQLEEESGGLLKISPEGDARGEFSRFNSAGIENEVGEFLYGLLRMTKPKRVLETGTHVGVGAAYLAAACQANGFGLVTTVEFLKENYEAAFRLLETLGLAGYVSQVFGDAADYVPQSQIDFLFLDTEPQTRFAELLKFYPYVQPGGMIGIHDLHRHMGQVENEEHGRNWPYGEIPMKMRNLILNDELRPMHFSTPRGLTMFYKAHAEDYDW